MTKTIIAKIQKKIEHDLRKNNGYKNLIFHSALTLTITSGFSYIFGFIRDRALSQAFGIGKELDIYYAAFVLPDILLAIFVTSCVSAVLIPIFSKKLDKNKDDARDYFYNILFFISTIIIVLAVLIAIFIPQFTQYLIKGFNEIDTKTYITVVRIMLISPILFAFSNFLGSVLISTKDFFFYGVAPIFYNIGIIIGVFLLVPKYGVLGVAFGTILGAFLHFLSRAIVGFSRVGFPKNKLKWNKSTTKTFKLMIPKMFQIGAWQVLLWWFTFTASSMEEGSISAYSIARNFQSMPVSLIGISIAISAFSTLSHIASNGDMNKFKKLVHKKVFLTLGLTTISAVILALLGKILISILFYGKSFDASSVERVSTLLIVYTISIPLESIMHIFTRAHYALQKTFRPSIIHIFSILTTIAISWHFQNFGISIIPISFAIGLLLQNVLLYISYINITKI